MKQYTLKLFLFLDFFILSSCLYAQNVITDTLTFEDNYIAGGTRFFPIDSLIGPIYPRRASLSRGNLEYTITGDIPDSLIIAIKEAFDTWNKCLPNAEAVINIQYTNNINSDIETSIHYLTIPNDNTISYPQSLYRHLFGSNDNFTTNDATIRINSASNWYIGISSCTIQKKNLNYAIKRAIAHSLGFGSSVVAKNHNYIVFGCRTGHTPSDNIIFNSNSEYLSSITNTNGMRNQRLETYVTTNQGNLYIKQQDYSHALYAPSTFDANRSLKYLVNSNSIMHYEDNQTLPPNIDETTLDVLAAIGWTCNMANDFEIVGENIDSTGVTSAYSSHRFYLNPGNDNIIDRHWECRLPLANGGYQTITANTSDFTIPAIQYPNNYLHNIDGCIVGEISFSGNLNGVDINAAYSVTLQLSPKILALELISVTPSAVNSNNYDITVGVHYEGAYGLMVSAREKGTSQAYTFHSINPYYAQIMLTDIRLWDDTYVTATVSNRYGVNMLTITVPSEGDIELLDFKPKNCLAARKFSSPRIVNLELSYDSLNVPHLFFENSKGAIRIAHCEDADSVVIHYGELDLSHPPFLPPLSLFFTNTLYVNDFVRQNGDTIEVPIDNMQWDDIYSFVIHIPQKGWMRTDTICVKDYIELPQEVLTVLEDKASGIEIPNSVVSCRLRKCEGLLLVETGERRVKSITITSLSGLLAAKSTNTCNIDISQIAHGIYLLSVITEDGIIINKKITL